LLGLIMGLIPLVCLVLLGMQVGPAYYEHHRVQEVLHSMDESGQTLEASDRELRAAFDRRAQVDDIHSLAGADLAIDKLGDRKVMYARYSAKVQLLEGVALLIDFSVSSRPGAGR
jgi:hypothetical protein